MNTIATDSLKALARRHNTTVADLRARAEDLALEVAYSPARRTWYLAEDATMVCRFNEFLDELDED